MKILAEDVSQIFGQVQSPISSYGGLSGIGPFITNIIRLIFVAGGIYALFNFLIAGFSYINAGGDSKKLEHAWSRIWQSLMGLVILVGSFALASLIGQIFFGNANFLLSPTIYGPGM